MDKEVTAKEIEKHLITQVFNEYKDGLFRTLLRLTGNRETASDILQDTFMTFSRKATRFDLLKEAGPYLYKVAVNNVKKNNISKGRLTLPGDDYLETLTLHEPKNDFIKDIAGDELVHRIKQAIDILPEKEHLVLTLRTFHNIPFSEIADSLKVSTRTAKRYMTSAKAVIKKELNNLYPPDFFK